MKHVVVGSGIVGIVIARTLQEKGCKVVLVESTEQVGGLLGKAIQYKCLNFDFGVHLIPSTSNAELNRILHGKDEGYTKEWNNFPIVKSGNFTLGVLNDQSAYMDVHQLSTESYQKACSEILNLQENEEMGHTLEEQISSRFGETIMQELYAPAVQKLFGVSMKQLTPNAYQLFLPPRVILGSTNINRELKCSEFYDQRIAYSTFDEAINISSVHYYPKQGGVVGWVEAMLSEFESFGGEVQKTTSIQSINSNCKKSPYSIKLKTGKQIYAESLWWTASPIGLVNLIGKKLNIDSPPTFRQTHLVHLVFDKPFSTDVQFVTCFDPALSLFRITLYPNLVKPSTEDKKVGWHCTVEFLNKEPIIEDERNVISTIVKEIKCMGVVPESANLIFATTQSLGNTFPVYDFAFKDLVAELSRVEQGFPKGIFLEGMAKGKNFFMRDVMLDAYKHASDFFEDTN